MLIKTYEEMESLIKKNGIDNIKLSIKFCYQEEEIIGTLIHGLGKEYASAYGYMDITTNEYTFVFDKLDCDGDDWSSIGKYMFDIENQEEEPYIKYIREYTEGQ